MEHTEEGMNLDPKCISVILELTHLTRSWVSKYQVPCCPQNLQKEATPTVACGQTEGESRKQWDKGHHEGGAQFWGGMVSTSYGRRGVRVG